MCMHGGVFVCIYVFFVCIQLTCTYTFTYTYCNAPIFSRFLQLAKSVHHRDPCELTVGFEGLSCVVIGFSAAYGVFWLYLRDLLFIVSQFVGSD